MLQSQVAGRHGSYATQFWRSSVTPHYRSRAAMRVAYSRKAIHRRLVLPLDSHNWVRSLEVLNAGYAKLGRTPEHYQAVLRDMVEHHGAYAELASDKKPPSSQQPTDQAAGEVDRFPSSTASVSSPLSTSTAAAEGILPAIDSLRDKAYAGEIPSNGSLWVTLVWAYCRVQQPQTALEAFHQARRRFRFSMPTLQHMAELLLPVLCRHGLLDEATVLYEDYLKPSTGDTTEHRSSVGAQGRRSSIDDAEARRWLAEAAARQGDWRKTQEFAATAAMGSLAADSSSRDGLEFHRPTINSLFHSHESSAFAGKDAAAVAAAPGSAVPLKHVKTDENTLPASSHTSLPVLSTLSPVAVRRLFQSLCRGGATDTRSRRTRASPTAAAVSGSEPTPPPQQQQQQRCLANALACWEHLYGPFPSTLTGDNETFAAASRARRTPPIQDVHELLNLFAAHGCWEAVLEFFCVAFLHCPSSVYRNATPAALRSSMQEGVVLPAADDDAKGETVLHRGLSSSSASLFPYDAELPLDAVTLNLVFACLPNAADPLQLRTRALNSNDESGRVLTLPAAARPVTVVSLLDDLLTLRDDMVLTDIVMSVVGPALLQVGQVERLFELLVRTPMMVRARERKAALQLSSQEQAMKSLFAALGYAAFALCRSEARGLDMVRRMPHLFPPEVVRRVATSVESRTSTTTSSSASAALAVLEGPVVVVAGESHSHPARSTLGTDAGEKTTTSSSSSLSSSTGSESACAATAAAPSLLDRRWGLYTDPVHTSPPRESAALSSQSHAAGAPHRSGRKSSAALLTSLADDAMRRDYLRLQETRHAAFTGSHTEAERDPRPIPKGLHDHASGWDFFGRGGEKVFANHKRTANPLTMRPKIMRALRNPYRGWNPRQNSSLAHKENVIKWNGKSAV